MKKTFICVLVLCLMGSLALPGFAQQTPEIDFNTDGDFWHAIEQDTAKNLALEATITTGGGYEPPDADGRFGAAKLNDAIADDNNGWYFHKGQYDWDGSAVVPGAGRDNAWVNIAFDTAVSVNQIQLRTFWNNGSGGGMPRRFTLVATLADDTEKTVLDYSEADYPNYQGFGTHTITFETVEAKSLKLICLEPDQDVSAIQNDYDYVYRLTEISVMNFVPSDTDDESSATNEEPPATGDYNTLFMIICISVLTAGAVLIARRSVSRAGN